MWRGNSLWQSAGKDDGNNENREIIYVLGVCVPARDTERASKRAGREKGDSARAAL